MLTTSPAHVPARAGQEPPENVERSRTREEAGALKASHQPSIEGMR
jgi:hypothetical protein